MELRISQYLSVERKEKLFSVLFFIIIDSISRRIVKYKSVRNRESGVDGKLCLYVFNGER